MKSTPLDPVEIQFSIKVSATDFPKREISGRIVTWNEVGSTSAGETIFTPNSITFGSSTKLLLEHNRTAPIGFLKSYKVNDLGIDATFAIGSTTAGSDALIEASSGLRDGFSVGVMADKYKNIDGILTISASTLKEVSLVTDPAIASAKVSIAASENDNSESIVEPEAPQTIEGDNEVETTPTVPDAPAEAVEASKPVNLGRVPMMTTAPRSAIVDAASYLEHSIRASLNPRSESAQWVAAADDNMGVTNPGFNPTRQLTEIINGLSNSTRGNIDAISRGTLPDAGLTFEIPKITTVPTVSIVAEEDAVPNTGTVSSFISVPIRRFAGMNTLSVELIDRSSPAFFNELLSIMGSALALAQTSATGAALLDGTLNATPQANTADGFLKYIASANAAVYAATQRFARSLVVSPEQWSNIMSYNDNGRPIYTAGQPMNSGGTVSGQSQVGVVQGLSLYVDNSGQFTGVGDYSMAVIDPMAFTWYESGSYRLDTNIVGSGQVDVSLYSYGAIASKIEAGANLFNLVAP